MEVGRVLVLLTILLPVVAKYTTRTTPKAKDIDQIADISKKYKIKPGHKMEPVHTLATGSATVNLSWGYSGFNSTSLLFGTGCVDSSGSLSGSAFNQLKLVTLSVI